MTGILGALNYQRKSGQFTLTKEEFNIVNLVVHGVSTNGRRVLNEAEMNHLKVDLLDYQDFIKKNNVEEITDAEWEIIKLVGRGMSNKEISTELSLSEGTVRNYLSTILSKLDLRDRTQLAIWEVQSGSAKYGRR